MIDLGEAIREDLEAIALEMADVDELDIPAMGNILNHLGDMEEKTKETGDPLLIDLILAIKGYLENLILREVSDQKPLWNGIVFLQSFNPAQISDKGYREELSDLFDKLGFNNANLPGNELPNKEQKDDTQIEGEDIGKALNNKETNQEQQPILAELEEEDLEILEDFVLESLESLSSIELELMNLEQDPEDQDTINAIFRPFHTIKGVSGFVNLKRINQLAHSAENLLDKAREKKIRIDERIIDVILDTVDLLKKMIEDVQEGLSHGQLLDKGIDTQALRTKIEALLSLDEDGDKLIGQILIDQGVVSDGDLDQALEKQREESQRRIGELLVKEGKVESKEVVSALRKQKKASRQTTDLHIKVDTEKLDNLVNLTGELVIAQAMIKQNQVILNANDMELYQNLSQLSQITAGLQDTAMSMRMIPIKATFQKMVRLIRDLGKNSGKEVILEMHGEDTEIDRNVVEELYEPMVHMIRNSVDHGIESPEERERSGKDRTGVVRLDAYHQGGQIIVEIKDDGKGLDKERIIEKAKSSNLIADDSHLTDNEIYSLIFHPGFSTAKQITNISGRGVGMDVVKKSIEKLRGRVEINSRPGQGSSFIISLPLTLAIIEGMLVRVGKERYIIPALTILESFRPKKSQYSTVEGKGEMILSRGNLLPLIRLDQIFGVHSDSSHPCDALVVAVEYQNKQMCIFLDELLGKEEVVIKNLGERLRDIKGIAGGAIMADGMVGLILDMAGVFEMASNN